MRILALFLLLSAPLLAAPKYVPTIADVVIDAPGGHELALDIYMPAETEKPPLVIFIHGGGWKNNSYKKCLTPWLTDYGFAVASISYRLTDKATFPAQIHDCKGAVRWLRAHATEYGYDARKIGVAGTSAGGHLAALLGVTAGVEDLEGDVAGHLDRSSRVQAIVDYYGATDFILRSQNQPQKTEKPDSIVYLLLGNAASKVPELAKAAGASYHVTEDDPPLLLIHGDKDTTVYLDQSERLAEEYEKLGLSVQFEVVKDGGHGGDVYFSEEYRAKVVAFLKAHLVDAPK